MNGGGVGGHVETGVAVPIPQDGTTLEVAGYTDLLSDRQEGGFFLRVRSGP